jgi:hypothetical protein
MDGGNPKELTKFEKSEFYRQRAEEYERNFMSLREIEWRLAIEVFTGYAAIGIAYFTIIYYQGASIRFCVGSIFLVLVLFGVIAFLSYCVQKRLHDCRGKQKAYIESAFLVSEIAKLQLPPNYVAPLWPEWYAFACQQFLSGTAAVSLILYFLFTTPACHCR